MPFAFAPPLVASPGPLPPPPAAARDLPGVAALVRWAAQAPWRGRWPSERLEREFCARTPAEVRADGSLDWTAPCHDLISLVAPALLGVGLPVTLVLGGIRRPLQQVKFQCGLEVALPDGAGLVVGFGISCAWLYPGSFAATRRRPWVLRQALDDWPLDRPLLSFFTSGGRAGLGAQFPGYDPPRHLREHQRWSRSWVRWRLARRKALDPAYAARPGRVLEAGGQWL